MTRFEPMATQTSDRCSAPTLSREDDPRHGAGHALQAADVAASGNGPAPSAARDAGRPLGVLTIAACPLPARRGTPVRIERLSEALMARGHKVTIATYHIGEVADPSRLDIVRTDRPFRRGSLPPGPSLAKIFRFDADLVATTRRVLASGSFDIIHAHHIEGLLIAALARPRGMPVVYDAHTMLASELPSYCPAFWRPMVRGVAEQFDRLLPRLADHVVCAGGGIRDALVGRLGFAEERVTVAGNGVEIEHFATAMAARARARAGGAGMAVQRIFYSGTLAGYQNIELLLEAFARLHRTHPGARLVIASNAPFAPLAPLAESLGVASAIDLLGDDFSALPMQLADSTIAVLPRTACDGVPQKLLNYMAAGCPVVASEGSAMLLTHEVTGLVVANGDAESFADGMRRLLDDPVLAERLGRQAHDEVARNRSWSAAAATVEAVYRALLAERERASRRAQLRALQS